MNQTKEFIPGYSGFIPSQENTEDVLQINKAKSFIPGYNGYIEGKDSENLIGKTYGRVTYLCSTKQHHIGGDVPPELRYLSQSKEEFRPAKELKVENLERLKIIEDAKKASGQFYGNEVMGYSSFDQTTLPLLTGDYKEKQRDQPQQHSNLTFEQAKELAQQQQQQQQA